MICRVGAPREAVEVHGSLGALIRGYGPPPVAQVSDERRNVISTTEHSKKLADDLKKSGLAFYRPNHRLCRHAGNGPSERPRAGLCHSRRM
jgi:hypothetical protein